MVAPRRPGAPTGVSGGVDAAAGERGGVAGCGAAGCEAMPKLLTRPRAWYLSGAPSEPCQLASMRSTRPRGSRLPMSLCVASPSGRRSAISASAARSSRSARRAPRSAVRPFVGVCWNHRLPPGQRMPSAVSNCRSVVANSSVSSVMRPARRPVTARSTSGWSPLPSEVSTRISARSAAPPMTLPSLTSAQTRSAPLPSRMRASSATYRPSRVTSMCGSSA